MLISEARLAGSSKGVIWGIDGASVILLGISAQAENIVLPGTVIATSVVAWTWFVVRMTVSIAVADGKIVGRCKPIDAATIPISGVLAATTAQIPFPSQGYGIRVIAKSTRGVLVGGPAVALETACGDGSSQLHTPRGSPQQFQNK
ncbi:hypothetical protein [Arthrobacter sp. 2MCAF14]|uniref:hypothetical protein n=1 Tax=Arthrobacter sp. 2MCAF14 TaxID=3232982 RepID=UPI003F931DD1